MKRQANNEAKSVFSAAQLKEVRQRYNRLQQELNDLPWILQGTVMETPPKSSTARATYTWTRKVRAKTVTVSLSPEQAIAFRAAIEANRRVEKALKTLRELSQDFLLKSLPGTRRRSTRRTE
jgi:hypothetical protein